MTSPERAPRTPPKPSKLLPIDSLVRVDSANKNDFPKPANLGSFSMREGHDVLSSSPRKINFAGSPISSFAVNTRSPVLGPIRHGHDGPSLEEIPHSPLVHLLLSTEGRDKMIKAFQYFLLSTVWAATETTLVSHAVDTNYWAHRLYANTVTLNNSRRLFRVGSFIEMVLSDGGSSHNVGLRMASIVKALLEDIGILIRKDFLPFNLPQTAAHGLWRPVLTLKLLLTLAELKQTFRLVHPDGWEKVLVIRDFRCPQKYGCSFSKRPSWNIESTSDDPQTGTIVHCNHCNAGFTLELVLEKTSKQRAKMKMEHMFSFPRLLRNIRGVYWLLGHKRCVFRLHVWRVVELLCELVATVVRLGWENIEPFADVADGVSVPRQRALILMCGLCSSLLSLFRVYDKGTR